MKKVYNNCHDSRCSFTVINGDGSERPIVSYFSLNRKELKEKCPNANWKEKETTTRKPSTTRAPSDRDYCIWLPPYYEWYLKTLKMILEKDKKRIDHIIDFLEYKCNTRGEKFSGFQKSKKVCFNRRSFDYYDDFRLIKGKLKRKPECLEDLIEDMIV